MKAGFSVCGAGGALLFSVGVVPPFSVLAVFSVCEAEPDVAELVFIPFVLPLPQPAVIITLHIAAADKASAMALFITGVPFKNIDGKFPCTKSFAEALFLYVWEFFKLFQKALKKRFF
jgi:hypothetical protein